MKPKIFLSHRHDDKQIADVISSHLRKWNVPSSDIHQSSAPRGGGRPGDNLNEELKKAIYEANLFILIYTSADEDWSYCMWECGVATDPTSENTRIIVFQCTDQIPRVYQEHVRVIVTPEKNT